MMLKTALQFQLLVLKVFFASHLFYINVCFWFLNTKQTAKAIINIMIKGLSSSMRCDDCFIRREKTREIVLFPYYVLLC